MAELDEYDAILGDGAKEEAEPDRVADKEQKDRSGRDKDREKRRSRSRDRKERKRSRSRDRDRDRRKEEIMTTGRDLTPPEVRAAREKERELKELERATRTVFAFNLNIKADERDIFEFFAKAGEVTDIRLITDRHTKRSKGLAYVEFSKQEEVFVALALTGQPMLGQPVMVKPAEAEKNLAWEAQQAAKQSNIAEAELAALGLAPLAGAAGAVPAGPLRLQVTGFKQGLGEAEIQQIFEPFGPVESVAVVRDGAGQPINIAYVVFKSMTDGQNAQAHWHGKVLLEHELSVVVAPLSGPLARAGGGADAGGVGDLDDGDFRLNTQTRAALMNRLANSAGMGPASGGLAAAANPLLGAQLAALPGMMPGMLAPSAVGISGMAAAAAAAVPGITAAVAPSGMPLPGMPGAAPGADLSLDQGLLGPPSPIPTQCLLLKNMFDAAQQAEAGWAEEVEDDVREECGKLGQLLHVFVDRTSQGFVYLKMGAVEGAAAAFKLLHGRFYNGHMIQAAYQFVQVYDQHFRL
ncbi:splicing factor, CC1-like protein [Scenedesmus sp. NREL 46B-D3]|nr:splicing factor, CC1-like protein [Scenedesmus sp. NREL 46B-D3]